MRLNDIIKIGDTIKKYRKQKNISQKEMSKILNIPYSTYSNYENNNRTPTTDILNKIAAALGITVNDLIKDDTIDITNMNDDTEFYIDCIIERPELKPIIDILKKHNYTLRQDIKGSDIHLIKNGIEEAYVPEDDFINFGLSMVNAINEFTEFQLNKLIDIFTMLS